MTRFADALCSSLSAGLTSGAPPAWVDIEALAALNTLSESEFLGGPGRGEDEIDVDPVFATPLDRLLRDLADDSGIHPNREVASILFEDPSGTALADIEDSEGFSIGLAIFSSSGRVLGLYAGCTLAVGPDHQGRGHGLSLVLARYLRDAELPLWHHDTPGFSPAGASVHRKAWLLLLDLA